MAIKVVAFGLYLVRTAIGVTQDPNVVLPVIFDESRQLFCDSVMTFLWH